MILDFIREALALASIKYNNRKNRLEKFLIAKAFNARYESKTQYIESNEWLTYTGAKDPSATAFVQKGYAWMCPECNLIHSPLSWSVFSGLQYPSCCGTFEGHRLFKAKP